MSEDPSFDHFSWKVHEIHLFELFDKKSMEFQKISSEFSKIIITNLAFINAGALVAVTPISTFIGASTLPFRDRLSIFGVSVFLFICGLVFALLCALATYYNYQYHYQLAECHKTSNLCTARIERATLLGNKELAGSQSKQFDANLLLQNKFNRAVRIWLYLGHIAGWLSLFAFIAGSTLIIINAPANAPSSATTR